MSEVYTQLVRYIYLDVVDFTVKRSVEAQTDIINVINDIVRNALKTLPITPERVILLPTGDGMGIALMDEIAPYDTHISGAIEILHRIKNYNETQSDDMRKFVIRIGINQNVDNVITDINGNKNVAGDGINNAQRVMSVAGGSNILVSQIVYETLSHREKYMKKFKPYMARIKHDTMIPVYQFIDPMIHGLDVSVPPQFIEQPSAILRFSLYEAYYIAHTIANEQFTLKNSGFGQNKYALTILYHFLAEDSLQIRTKSKYKELMLHIYGKESGTIEKAFRYYMSIDFWVCSTLCDYVEEKLSSQVRYFEIPYIAPNKEAKLKLKEEFPEIYDELKLTDT